MMTARDTERRVWTAMINGNGLRVEEVGEGTAIVFSPNPFTNRELFDEPVAALCTGYRCITYDHRGQGDSGFGVTQPSADLLSTEGLYADAEALLDRLGVDSCHWVGSSIGGFVGVRLAARRPERVRSLTLLGFTSQRVSKADRLRINLMIGMTRATRRLGRAEPVVLRRIAEQVMRNMFGTTFMSDPARADDRNVWRQRFMSLLVPEAADMFRAVFGHPGTPPEMLARVLAPTLIVAGEDELAAFAAAREDVEQAQRIIPDARLVTIPGAGHMVLIEQPETGTAAITEFIRAVDAA